MSEKREYTNTRPSKVSVGRVIFGPGESKLLDKHLYEALEQTGPDGELIHPLRKGPTPILKPGVVAMPPPMKPALDSLEKLDGPKALAQVRLCDDLELLAGWYAKETREDLRKAIEARGKELRPR